MDAFARSASDAQVRTRAATSLLCRHAAERATYPAALQAWQPAVGVAAVKSLELSSDGLLRLEAHGSAEARGPHYDKLHSDARVELKQTIWNFNVRAARPPFTDSACVALRAHRRSDNPRRRCSLRASVCSGTRTSK